MSLVIATISKNNVYILGDTQLNNEIEPIEETGMKVIPIGNHTLVGFTGTYRYFINMAQSLTENIVNASFKEKVLFVKEQMQGDDVENNAVIVGIENGMTKYSIFGSNYGYNLPINTISHNGIDIKLLMPPDITEEFCKPYITSPLCLDYQMFSCIEAVSHVSSSVNNKICGFYMNNERIDFITKNINYNEITYRWQINE